MKFTSTLLALSALLGVSLAADCYCEIKTPNTPDQTRNSDSQGCCSGTGDWTGYQCSGVSDTAAFTSCCKGKGRGVSC